MAVTLESFRDIVVFASYISKNGATFAQNIFFMASFLQIENVTKSFGDLILFEGLKFSVEENQRVALVARNGAGNNKRKVGA